MFPVLFYCCLFLPAGGILLLLAERRTHRLVRTDGRITGVCDNAFRPDGVPSAIRIGGGADNYCPLITFDAEGRTWRKAGLIAWNRSFIMKRCGKKVPVYYPAGHPEHAHFTRWNLLHALSAVFLLAAMLSIIIHALL